MAVSAWCVVELRYVLLTTDSLHVGLDVLPGGFHADHGPV
jgi:hypothetical protein